MLSLALLLGTGCGHQEVWEVDHYRSSCHGIGPGLCVTVKDALTGKGVRVHGGIKGFSHEWGYRYKIEVAVTPVLNPPQDGSSVRYELVRILEKTPVSTDESFAITAGPRYIEKDAQGGYQVASKAFVCQNQAVRDVLGALLKEESDGKLFFYKMTFLHAQTKGGPLVLTGVSKDKN